MADRFETLAAQMGSHQQTAQYKPTVLAEFLKSIIEERENPSESFNDEYDLHNSFQIEKNGNKNK